VNFTEEEVDEHGESPEDQIVHPPDERWNVRAFVSHSAVSPKGGFSKVKSWSIQLKVL
jgi:hypothetical protein